MEYSNWATMAGCPARRKLVVSNSSTHAELARNNWHDTLSCTKPALGEMNGDMQKTPY